MPRVIVKCRYYKTEKTRKNIGGYLEYIAKREGVDRLEDGWKTAKVTELQKRLIGMIEKQIPIAKSLVEYREYTKHPTRGSASEFISRAVEENHDLLESKTYLDYIATRPRAERIDGKHGLFSDNGKVLNLPDEVRKLSAHNGVIYTVIISLTREDAERLGYNNAERWRDFLRAQKTEIAKQHRIPLDKLCWYGAFHNEAHHPHVHMVLYSTDETEPGYLSKKGIDNLRHTFGTGIFRDDLINIYDEQTARRNTLTAEARDEFEEVFMQMQTGVYTNRSVIDKVKELAEKLNVVTGKKTYGLLPKELKQLVDQIVDELAEDERLKRLYDLWYESECAIYKTYTDTMPPKKPLSQEETFKPIRNALIKHAIKLGEAFNEIEGSEHTVNDTSDADTGDGEKADDDKNKGSSGSTAHSSQHQPNQTAHTAKHGVAITTVTRLARDASNIFRDRFNENADKLGLGVDSRLRREIEAKKKGQNISM